MAGRLTRMCTPRPRQSQGTPDQALREDPHPSPTSTDDSVVTRLATTARDSHRSATTPPSGTHLTTFSTSREPDILTASMFACQAAEPGTYHRNTDRGCVVAALR